MNDDGEKQKAADNYCMGSAEKRRLLGMPRMRWDDVVKRTWDLYL